MYSGATIVRSTGRISQGNSENALQHRKLYRERTNVKEVLLKWVARKNSRYTLRVAQNVKSYGTFEALSEFQVRKV